VERYRWDRPVIRALGILKKCAALANGELSQFDAWVRSEDMVHPVTSRG